MQCCWTDTNLFLHLLQNVPGDAPKEKKPSKTISPGTFFGMSKVLKPKMTSVQATRIKAVAQPVGTPRKQIVTPFQAMPKRQEQPGPLLQLKFDVSVASKPDFNTHAGRFIPSEAEMMGLKSKENAEELHMRYIPGYISKQSGSVEYLNPTERSKIAANIAMKIMGERVAIQATLEKSFDKDEWMSSLIDQAKWLRDCGHRDHAARCTCKVKHKCHAIIKK